MGSGFVVGGQREAAPFDVDNWHDNPAFRLRMGNDGGRRPTKWVRLVTVHSTKGIPGGKNRKPQRVYPGLGPAGNAAEANVRYWTSSDSNGGAHIVVDFDGQVICTADLQDELAYHATSVNEESIGIEVVQGEADDHAFFYRRQLDRVMQVIDWLTKRFRIQRQFPGPFPGHTGWVSRLVRGGADCVGVHQHCDQTANRGVGDCGEWLRDDLRAAGYEEQDWSKDADKRIWSTRQTSLIQLGADPAIGTDGVPGPKTSSEIERLLGKKHGLWISRPGD
jgi:hypothetical protein